MQRPLITFFTLSVVSGCGVTGTRNCPSNPGLTAPMEDDTSISFVADPAPAPAFTLEDRNPNAENPGKDVSPNDRLGTISIWYFSAATCPYSRTQFPSLLALHGELVRTAPGAEFRVVAVNRSGADRGLTELDLPASVPVLQDTRSEGVWRLWSVRYRDVVVVDESGQIVAYFNVTRHDLRTAEGYAALRELLLEVASGGD